MPLQQDSEPEIKSEKLKKGPISEIEKAKDELRAAVTRAKAEERARLKAEKALTDAQAALEASRVEEEQEHQARENAEQALAKAQKDLATLQAEFEKERQARIKADRATAEAERAVAEMNKSSGAEIKSVGVPSPALLEQGTEKRITFVLRTTVDEQGQPRRMEVEHPLSGKIDRFPSLDVQKLAAFIQECISPPAILEPSALSEIAPIGPEEPVSQVTLPGARLTVSEVQVSQAETTGFASLVLSPDKAFLVQIQFELVGPEAPAVVAQESTFEIKVYANDVTRGTSSLLTTYVGHLLKDVLEYAAQLQVTGLSPGFYRLLTLVTLQAPINMAGYYEGPVLEVVEIQPTPNLVAPL